MAQKLLTICKALQTQQNFVAQTFSILQFLSFIRRFETLLNGSFCDMHTIIILLCLVSLTSTSSKVPNKD